MKTLLASVAMLLLACAADNDPIADLPEVTYEVITASGAWYGVYLDETGKNICFCQTPLPNSGWKYTFHVPELPFTLHIGAATERPLGDDQAPDVTCNIYVDDVLVASNTSTFGPDIARADYVLE